MEETSKKCAAGYIGYRVCLDNRELMSIMIDFAILQLRFLADLSQSKGRENELALIPESLVKLPSQYIAQVATSFQQYLSPKQAEDAVKYATILLGSVKKLSVQVQMELVRISGAFIRASVQREESKQRRKIRSRKHAGSDDNDVAIDRRELNIFCSLDKNDHGVVVFASPVASEHLGPCLIRSFIAMDAVEGLDVEREHHFHKNMVQAEIVCELILHLWQHPSGDFKTSITSMGNDILAKFCSSVASSICIESYTSYQTMVDICDILDNHVCWMVSLCPGNN